MKQLKFKELRGSLSGLNRFFIKNVKCLGEVQKTVLIPLSIRKNEELSGVYFKALILAMGLSEDEFNAALEKKFTEKNYLSKLYQTPQLEIDSAYFVNRLP
ncbi:MAG: hypothetical protein M1371_10775 [Actinobacteria bacterium]|nr:hypothetical protein [Actinomycetota bacterium]